VSGISPVQCVRSQPGPTRLLYASFRPHLAAAALALSLTLPSRPGEFHLGPLTDSGRDTLASSGSCHRLKAAAFRQDMRLFRFPVDRISASMTHPLRSTSITPASSLLRGGPPLYRRIATFSLADEPLVPFRLASPDRFSSSVRKPEAESRLLYTGHRMTSK
jgi:hypothetical protein